MYGVAPATRDALGALVAYAPDAAVGGAGAPACPAAGSGASLRAACTAAAPGATFLLSGAGFPAAATAAAAGLMVTYDAGAGAAARGATTFTAACAVVVDYSRLLCALAPGAGANLTWRVIVGGVSR